MSAAARSKADNTGQGFRGGRGKRDYDRQRDGVGGSAYMKPKMVGVDKRSYTCYECHGNPPSLLPICFGNISLCRGGTPVL